MAKKSLQLPLDQKENLRRNGLYNTISNWIDTITKMVTEFVTRPWLIILLGNTDFGSWQILNQLNGYMAAVDLQSGTSLKYYISKYRNTNKPSELRKVITSAVLSNLIFLPIYLCVGFVIVYLAPLLIKSQTSDFYFIRKTTLLLVFAFIFQQYSFILHSIIVGMNISYKCMGIRSVIVIASGFGLVFSCKAGYSLPGMACVIIITAAVNAVVYLYVIKKNIPWFGFGKTDLKNVTKFLKLTGKYMLLKFVDLLNGSTDLIIIGYTKDTATVTAYSVTRYVLLGVNQLCNSFMNGVTPGLSKILGSNDYIKFNNGRSLVQNIIFLAITFVGSYVLLFNKAFVTHWTSEKLFIGELETLLLVLLFIFKQVGGVDAAVISMSMKIEQKIKYSFYNGIFTIALSIPLINFFGLKGLISCFILNALIAICYYLKLSLKITNKNINQQRISYFKKLAIVTLLLISFYLLKPIIDKGSISNLAIKGVLPFLGLVSVAFFAFHRNEKIQLINHLNKLLRKSN
ncbi:lipopolysaccharide biosynthesis protein [Verrucomicrobia bacterium]|nr:lipopolysaccharide biosynthesis protein [Verrucomicrobiota bacterium]